MKKLSKSLLALVLILSLIGLAGCGGDTNDNSGDGASLENFEKQVLKIGSTITPVNGKHIQWQTLEFLDEEINKATNGLIDLELYPSGQLGGERDVLEGLSMGTFKIADPYSVMGTISDIYNVFDMPYLFRDYDHFVAVCKSDIPIEMGKTLEAHNIKYLGMGSASGPYHLSSADTAIKTPADLKGLKIRAMDSPFILDAINAIGAQAVPMAWTEVYTGLQQHTIDGVCTINTGYYTAKLYEVQKHIAELGMFYSPTFIVANLDWFNSLPKELQEGLQEGVTKAMERHYIDCAQQDKEVKQKLIELGVSYTDDEIDHQAFRDAVKPVYEKYQDKYGEWIEKIQAIGE